MPPAVVAAGIGLAGTLGGGLIASGAQKSAQKSQQQANNQALQYQRERDAAADKRYERDYADRQRALAAKDATRRAIAKHYGIDLPGGGPAWMNASVPLEGPRPVNPLSPTGPPVGAPAPMPAGPAPSPTMAPTMAPTMPTSPAGAPPAPDQAPAPEMSNWSNWSNYARL